MYGTIFAVDTNNFPARIFLDNFAEVRRHWRTCCYSRWPWWNTISHFSIACWVAYASPTPLLSWNFASQLCFSFTWKVWRFFRFRLKDKQLHSHHRAFCQAKLDVWMLILRSQSFLTCSGFGIVKLVSDCLVFLLHNCSFLVAILISSVQIRIWWKRKGHMLQRQLQNLLPLNLMPSWKARQWQCLIKCQNVTVYQFSVFDAGNPGAKPVWLRGYRSSNRVLKGWKNGVCLTFCSDIFW